MGQPKPLSNNFDSATKIRIRRGYYGTHKKGIDEALLATMQAHDVARYMQKADAMDKEDRRNTLIGWGFGILFYGGIGLAILFSSLHQPASNASIHAGEHNNSTSSPAASVSEDPASSSPEPASTYVAPTSYSSDDYSDVSGSDDGCNLNYSGCVEDSPYDLDCPDIGREVQVIGDDVYNLDRDGDGWGCESY